MREERLDLGGPKLGVVPLAVEADEAFNPIDAGLLGPDAVMLDADLVTSAVEQARRGRRVYRMTGLGSPNGTFPVDLRALSRAAPYDKRMMDALLSVTHRFYIFR